MDTGFAGVKVDGIAILALLPKDCMAMVGAAILVDILATDATGT